MWGGADETAGRARSHGIEHNWLREIAWFLMLHVVYEIPVSQECLLKSMHYRPLEPRHRVAPQSEVVAQQIPVRNVHSSSVTNLAVDDDDFPVIAVVHMAEYERKLRREK